MKVNYDDLQMAMTCDDPYTIGRHFLDTQTGEVVYIDEYVTDLAPDYDDLNAIADESVRLAWCRLWYDGEVGPELPEAEEQALSQQVDAYLARFVEVPQMSSRDGCGDMVNFASTVDDPHLRELLEVALNGRGAFRRFKDVLYNYPEERQRWFDFSAQRWRKRIDDWLRGEGLLPWD